MKRSQTEAPDTLDPELDTDNEEFDFSEAPRPGRIEQFERAQGHFYEVTDAEHAARSGTRLLAEVREAENEDRAGVAHRFDDVEQLLDELGS